ncbi:MAG: lactonase family protein, partial [Acidiferrobacteraceae bacterium]
MNLPFSVKTAFACLAALALGACGSPLNSGNGGGGGGPTLPACSPSAPTSTHYLFVAGLGDNALARYSVNASGTLQPLDCAPYGAAPGLSQPTGLDYDTGANLLFVSNYTSNTVAAFSFNSSTGTASPVSGSPFAAGITPWAVTTDRLQQYVYVANGGSAPSQSISAYRIGGPSTLTPVATSASAAGPAFALAADPVASYLYAADYSGPDTVSAYTINNTTGALSLIGDFPAGGSYPRSVVVDPSGSYVYVANTDRSGDQCGGTNPSGTTIAGFIIAAGGSLTSIGTFSSGLAPQSLAITSVGGSEFLYSANYCSDDIGVYRIG